MKKLLKIIIILTLSISCSVIKLNKFNNSNNEKELILSNYQELNQNDYVEHFIEFERFYLKSQSVEVLKLSDINKNFLLKLVENITKNNELFFKNNLATEFYIIKNASPYHFSLPGRKIFISSGLIQKYIKSEKLLYCLLTYELIRSEKGIYHKTLIVPTGTLNTQRILSLMRLTTAEKVEIHKWAFYILKRLGIDTDHYLSWIQIQNRNSIDFSLQLGDINSISREESMFKAFLINNTKDAQTTKKYGGSSKDFYNFINKIKS